MRLEMCSHALLNCEQELQTPPGIINPVVCHPDVPSLAPALLDHIYPLINIHEQMGEASAQMQQ